MLRDINPDMNRPEITRRRVLAMLAGAATTTTAAVAVGSEEADADIQFGTLSVSDGTHESEDPQVTPVVTVDAEFSYTVESVTDYNVSLELGPDHDNRMFVDLVSTETAVMDGQFSESLSGPVTDIDAYSQSDFAPAAGETVTEDIAIALTLSVMDGGATMVTAAVEDTATITVTNTGVNTTVALGGEGEITFE